MFYRILADLTLILHLIFIIFVLLGGLLLLRNKKWAIIHLPSALWASLAEFKGLICPLTPLENLLRQKGGGETFQGSFIEHYLLPIIYPSSLTGGVQILLGMIVVVTNLIIYLYVFNKYRAGS